MKQTFVGLRTIEAEARSLHEHLRVLGVEIQDDTPDDAGFVFNNDDGQPTWIPAEVFQDTFRASAPALDVESIWKAVREVVEPKEGEAPKPTGPRVTLEGILAKVKGEEFFPIEDWAMVTCRLELENGTTLVGQWSAHKGEPFDEAKGRELARQDALAKAWPLEGYLLRERLYRDAGRNRSIARLCHDVYRANAKGDPTRPWEHANEDFEKLPSELQAGYMSMVEGLRADQESEHSIADSSPCGHLFRAVVRSLG